jgi:hypothetical protein
MILGCPRPKLFFFGLPNLLPQKVRLPLISFFSGVNFGQITTTFTTIIQKGHSFVRSFVRSFIKDTHTHRLTELIYMICVHGFISFLIDLPFFSLCLCSSSFTFLFEHVVFFHVIGVLSIASLDAPPFQKNVKIVM